MTQALTRPTPAELTVLKNPASHDIVTVTQLRNAGISPSAIAARCRPGGPWRRLLPGVVLLDCQEPTREQRLHAAVAQMGADTVITGGDALRAHGIPLPLTSNIRLLVSAHRRILPQEFVTLERTTRLPRSFMWQGLPYSPPARAVLDTARRETDPDQLHKLLTLPIYHGLCSIEQLCSELDAGNQRGSAAVRDALKHLGPMVGTFTYRTARELLKRTPLPPPRWNISICDRLGQPLGRVDAWWEEIAMGWQFNADGSTEIRPSVKHLALTAAGVTLVRSSPEKLSTEGNSIARELISAFSIAARRTPPQVQAFGLCETT